MKCSYPQTKKVTIRGTVHQRKHPCGQCRECRHARRSAWAIRCFYESLDYPGKALFITLTYQPKHLPGPPGPYGAGSLSRRDFTLFLKRLRKLCKKLGVRYFACGEYGDGRHRPHYHICLFGLTEDQARAALIYAWSIEGTDTREERRQMGLYEEYNNILEDRTALGHVDIKPFDIKTAAYTAAYTVKGATSEEGWYFLHGEDPREREFSSMSQGIGKSGVYRIIHQMQGHHYAIENHPETCHWSDWVTWIPFPRVVQVSTGGKPGQIYPLDSYMQGKLRQALGLVDMTELGKAVLENLRENYERNRVVSHQEIVEIEADRKKRRVWADRAQRKARSKQAYSPF